MEVHTIIIQTIIPTGIVIPLQEIQAIIIPIVPVVMDHLVPVVSVEAVVVVAEAPVEGGVDKSIV